MIYQNERPLTFSEMKGQAYVVENIRNQSKRNTWFQQYILGGQFGSGKTTMARIILRAANCEHKDEDGNPCGNCNSCRAIASGLGDFREIDGASNTGVDNIRELQEYVSFRPTMLKRKVIIIDEVHKLSSSAFNSLLKILEEPPQYVIFILCTTDVDAIPQTVQSRCAVYRFGPIEEDVIKQHVMDVAVKNHISVTDDAAFIIARNSQGAMRNALKLLEQLSSAGTLVTADLCKETLGISDEEMVFDFIRSILKSDVGSLLHLVDEIGAKGKDYLMLSRDLVTALSDLVIASCAGSGKVKGSALYVEEAEKLSKEFSLRDFCLLSEELIKMVSAIKKEGTRNNFLIQGVALMERMRESEQNLSKRMDELDRKLTDAMAKGIMALPSNVDTVITQEETSQEDNLSADRECPVGNCTEDELENGFYSTSEPIPFEEKEGIDQAGKVSVEFSEGKSETTVVDIPQKSENSFGLEDLEDFDDFFDDDYVNGCFDEALAPYNGELKTARKSVGEQADRSTIATSSRAQEALKKLEKLILQDHEIADLVKNKCVQRIQEQGVILTTPDGMTATCLTLCLAKQGIVDIHVELDPCLVIS